MAYRVAIDGVWVICDTPDEVIKLVDRYNTIGNKEAKTEKEKL